MELNTREEKVRGEDLGLWPITQGLLFRAHTQMAAARAILDTTPLPCHLQRAGVSLACFPLGLQVHVFHFHLPLAD